MNKISLTLPRFCKLFLPLMAALAALMVFNSYRPFFPPAMAGYTEVNANVGENGESRLSIPVAVPKGTILTPEISIGYSSQAGNGLLGQGFQIEGLYSISRVGANKAEDGFIDGVDFDNNDRYAMNGERLVKVKGANYGGSGSEYSTEQTNFSKTVAYGGNGYEPQYWRTWTKSGLIMEFGNTTDSRIEASAPNETHPLVWLVNKISDTKGNYMTFTYIENATNGEFRIDRIQYTGNSNNGQLPYNSIQFYYEPTRPDTITSYLSGSKMKLTQRLFKIETIDGQNGGNGTVYRTYEFDYQQIGYKQTSHLESVTEKGSDGQGFPPTVFNWTVEGHFPTLELPFATNTHAGFYTTTNNFPGRIRAGDVTGDGLMDLVLGPTISNNEGNWYVLRSTGTSFVGEAWATNTGANSYPSEQGRTRLLDLNSDGKLDLVYSIDPRNQPWKVRLSTGTSFGSEGIWYNDNFDTGSSDRIWPMDANGDGRQDIVAGPNALGEWYVFKNSGSNTFIREKWVIGAYGNSDGTWQDKPDRIHPMDMDGDGLSDFVLGPSDNGSWFVLKNTGSAFIRVPNAWLTNAYASWKDKSRRIYEMDFNGDGLMEFVFGPEQTTGKWYALRNTGTAFQDLGTVGTGLYANYYNQEDYIRPMDINGDGLTDFVFGPEANGTWYCLYNNGRGLELGYDNGLWLTEILGAWHENTRKLFVRPLDVNGDGAFDLCLGPDQTGRWEVVTNRPSENSPHLLRGFTNGHGATTEFSYEKLTEPTTYQKGTAASFPKMDFVGPLYVVNQLRTDDGVGGKQSIHYKYYEAKLDLEGRGFRGFGKTEQIDSLHGMKTIVFYERAHQFISTKVSATEQRLLSNDQLVYSVTNTLDTAHYNNYTVYFSNVKVTEEKWYELNQATPYKTKLTTLNYDNWGNVTSIVEDNNGQYPVNTTNIFTNDTTGSKWLLGRLTEATVSKTLQGQAPITKKSTFAYDPASGLLTQEILNSTSSNLKLQTDYTLDVYGNRLTETTSGPGIASRTNTFTYDSKGRNLSKAKNPLNQEINYTYELGLLKTTTDPNGLTETISRDGFGRPTTVFHPDGTQTNTLYQRCDGPACPEKGVYYVETSTDGGAKSKTYLDLLDREIRSESYGLNGAVYKVDTGYDSLGRVAQKSEPYLATSYWHVFNYDAYQRVVGETAPGNRFSSVQYNGFTTTYTNPENQTKKRTVNAMDWLAQSKDHQENAVNYTYDSDGNMKTVADPDGNTTFMSYDSRGNKTSMDDPDLGLTTYTYNTLGLLTSQTYNSGDVITLTYDLLNRRTQQVEPERTLTWEYDTKPNGVGMLAKSFIDGTVSEEYNYDYLGRTTSKLETVEGTTYTTSFAYDGFSRPLSMTYPVTGFKLRYGYDTFGNLKTVKNFNNASLTYWQVDSLNNKGQISKYTLGNGLSTRMGYDAETGFLGSITTGNAQNPASIQHLSFTWSPTGNLTQRKDQFYGLEENFQYDVLNRLTESHVVGQQAVTVQYNAIGNITYKSNVGTYTYGQGGAGPHMVTSINPSGIQNCLTPFSGTVSYTSYNYPEQIKQATDTISFTYSADRMKQTQRYVKNGSMKWQKHYVNGIFEKLNESGQTKYIHHIGAMGETVAILQTGVGSDTLRYLHKDHLGSLHRMTDEVGILQDTYSFDAWGKPRSPYSWAPILTSSPPPPYQRGYTFHEMMGIEDLVHMNARLYDPSCARVLSPDPFVKEPDNLQDLNRASYVVNNPLRYTDPTGFSKLSEFLHDAGDWLKENAGTIVQIGLAIITSGWSGPLGTILSGMVSGFGGAFVGTLALGGDFSDAFRNGLRAGAISGLSAGLSDGIGEYFGLEHQTSFLGTGANAIPKAIVHGIAQGGISELQGGDFLSGFAAGAISTLGNGIMHDGGAKLGKIGRVAVSATLGGTASAIAGGSFANGAITGAFIQLFNEEAGSKKKSPYKKGDKFDENDPRYEPYDSSAHGKGNRGFISKERMISALFIDKYDEIFIDKNGRVIGGIFKGTPDYVKFDKSRLITTGIPHLIFDMVLEPYTYVAIPGTIGSYMISNTRTNPLQGMRNMK